VRQRTRSRSEEAEVDELAPERLGHRREVAGGAAEVARGVLRIEVAPALERPMPSPSVNGRIAVSRCRQAIWPLITQ
jgi:hypothetical protein